MYEILLAVYIINSILLINHEIESGYWKEWELFKLPGEITGFLLMHFPLLFIILYGIVLITLKNPIGLIFSVIISLSGYIAFFIHGYFIKKGRKEFTLPISKFLLWSMFLVSTVQIILTGIIMVG